MAQIRSDWENSEIRDVRDPERLLGGSPSLSPGISPSRFSTAAGDKLWDTGSALGRVLFWILGDPKPRRWKRKRCRAWYQRTTAKTVVVLVGFFGFFFLVNWFMLSRLHEGRVWLRRISSKNQIPEPDPSRGSARVSLSVQGDHNSSAKSKKNCIGTYERMLALAAHALADGQNNFEPKDLWQEPKDQASAWQPCADQRSWDPNEGENGFIMVTANGGINQQRVAVCNSVVVARLLNATLVVPKFMFSDVWADVSQFGDIYQEEHFIKYLSPDIQIVKELPKDLQSLDLEAIGSIVTDEDIMKEAKLSFYYRNILPILLKNRVVHFVGFGNRLAFDPIPFELQRLRCRCNFRALIFVPKIQETAALLVRRLRLNGSEFAPLDQYLIGPKFASSVLDRKTGPTRKASKYLALHLRFEIDMVAHSVCDFGGGEEERRELEAYREKHFPGLALLARTNKLPSPEALRSEGLCPLTPEEAVLMLAALGFNRKTLVFVAGANIYGGTRRLSALTNLYPNLVTKEKLLSPAELEPFKNFSSQLAALDFIGCAVADAFAMTDSGSQFSSLVSGYRIYYGGGEMPTIRPNKRRLSGILSKNDTIEWSVFEQRVRKTVRQSKHVNPRPKGRSVFRYPRCKECMCNAED